LNGKYLKKNNYQAFWTSGAIDPYLAEALNEQTLAFYQQGKKISRLQIAQQTNFYVGVLKKL